jgi:hypothetical protein
VFTAATDEPESRRARQGQSSARDEVGAPKNVGADGVDGRVSAAAAALTSHPVHGLPFDLLESTVDRRVRALVIAILGRGMANERLMPRKAEMNRDAVAVPMGMMMTRQLDDDVARDDGIEEPLKLVGTLPDVNGKRLRVHHASEREL